MDSCSVPWLLGLHPVGDGFLGCLGQRTISSESSRFTAAYAARQRHDTPIVFIFRSTVWGPSVNTDLPRLWIRNSIPEQSWKSGLRQRTLLFILRSPADSNSAPTVRSR
jgi:hypothetical protein